MNSATAAITTVGATSSGTRWLRWVLVADLMMNESYFSLRYVTQSCLFIRYPSTFVSVFFLVIPVIRDSINSPDSWFDVREGRTSEHFPTFFYTLVQRNSSSLRMVSYSIKRIHLENLSLSWNQLRKASEVPYGISTRERRKRFEDGVLFHISTNLIFIELSVRISLLINWLIDWLMTFLSFRYKVQLKHCTGNKRRRFEEVNSYITTDRWKVMIVVDVNNEGCRWWLWWRWSWSQREGP